MAMICPHCGHEPNTLLDYHLIPEHSFDGRRCPGSLQIPRNGESDKRPLLEGCLRCEDCGGEGTLDSGGFYPWGESITVGCETCRGTGARP